MRRLVVIDIALYEIWFAYLRCFFLYIGIFIDGATYTLNLKKGVYWRRVTVIDCIAGAGGAREKCGI